MFKTVYLCIKKKQTKSVIHVLYSIPITHYVIVCSYLHSSTALLLLYTGKFNDTCVVQYKKILALLMTLGSSYSTVNVKVINSLYPHTYTALNVFNLNTTIQTNN